VVCIPDQAMAAGPVRTVEVTLHTTHAVSPDPGPWMETIFDYSGNGEPGSMDITSEFIRLLF